MCVLFYNKDLHMFTVIGIMVIDLLGLVFLYAIYDIKEMCNKKFKKEHLQKCNHNSSACYQKYHQSPV